MIFGGRKGGLLGEGGGYEILKRAVGEEIPNTPSANPEPQISSRGAHGALVRAPCKIEKMGVAVMWGTSGAIGKISLV